LRHTSLWAGRLRAGCRALSPLEADVRNGSKADLVVSRPANASARWSLPHR
jgi:hypothetical protein